MRFFIFENDEITQGFALFLKNVDFPLEVMKKSEGSPTLLYKRLRAQTAKCKNY
jgi:hypothetical protein